MNSKKWNEVVNKSEDSKIYHLLEWGTLLENIHGHKLFYINDNENVLALSYVKSYLFGNRLISLPFADYGGPCLSNNKSLDYLISKAKEIGRNLDVDFIEIRSPNEASFDILIDYGFIRRDDYATFILRIDSQLNILWNLIGKKNRNMIRKGYKMDIKIIEGSCIEDIKIFYKMYTSTMKSLGSPPQPYTFFREIWRLFYPNNVKLLIASYEGRNIASSLYFLHKKTIHHAYNCAYRTHFGLGQNNLMQWYIIKWGNEKGFKYLDFGRTRTGAGNEMFKRHWNGEVVMMPYFYMFYKKELKERQEIKYKAISELWRKYMPEKAANIIGPSIIRQIG